MNIVGSSEVLTTTEENEEIIPDPPEALNWTMGYKFRVFEIQIDQDATVEINDSDPIFYRAGKVFLSKSSDGYPIIESFKIAEIGKTYTWYGIF